MRLSYNPSLKRLAREPRNRSTLSEVLPWRELKRGQRGGFDFHRQKPVSDYILDFFSLELMLAVEIDGKSHKLKGPDDDIRQRRLEAHGIKFLRFDDRMVKQNLDAVVRSFDAWIHAHRPEH